MSLYRELRPDPASLPIEIARTSLEQSRRALTRPFGQAIVTNGAGGTSILGAGGGDGLIPWVDDSEPPSRPTGLSAASTSQVITVHWDGTLEYGLPADFHSIEIHIQPDGGDDTVIGTLRVAGDVASGLLTEGAIVDVWAVALDDAHDRVGEWTPNRSEASDVITLVVEPVVSQGQLRDKADEILDAAKEDTENQITIVNNTINEAQQAIEANREGLEQEAYLRAEADRAAQETTAAIKTDTDKLKGDYANVATDVASVKQDMLDTVQRVESAQTTADSKNKRFVQPEQPTYDLLKPGDEWWQTSSKPPETYWLGDPNNSVSVLVDHSGEVEHIWTWNGTRWADLMLAADSLFVRGTVSAGLVSADFFDGAVVKGGAFVTSNERIQLNNNGFAMVDALGNPVVTLDAKTGEAILQSVNIIGAGLSTPAISGGSIEGADYKLTTGSGATKTTVAQINSDGIIFGDHLSYAKNAQGQWVLSLAGAIQSGGEISSAVITAPTIQTSSAENTGLKFTSGGLVAFDANGNTTFTLDNTGGIMMAGALMSNSEIISSNIYTSPDADNRVSITSAGLTVTHGGHTVISFAADGAVDLGTSGIASDSRVSDLTDEVHDSYTPLDVFDQTTGVLADSVADVQEQAAATSDRLDEEIDARKQYMQFDPNNGLTIGDLTNTDAYSVQLTSTAMQFRAGNTVAAYVSNDRLYINNAEVVNTLRIGNFAFLPRDNGHMSLQYVGGDITQQEA